MVSRSGHRHQRQWQEEREDLEEHRVTGRSTMEQRVEVQGEVQHQHGITHPALRMSTRVWMIGA